MSFDNRMPTSGEDYLRMVRAQARLIPEVTIAESSRSQAHLAVKNTSFKYRTDWKSCEPAPPGCAPTPEWKLQFMIEFRQAREKLLRDKEKRKMEGKMDKVKHDPKGQQQNESRIPQHRDARSPILPKTSQHADIKLPGIQDDRGWRALLYGPPPMPISAAEQTHHNDNSSIHETAIPNTTAQEQQGVHSDENSSTTTTSITSDTSAANSTPQPRHSQGLVPTPQFLLRLNQGHLMILLRYHLRWIAEDNITVEQGRWLYALLMKLDPLVESDQVAALRNLAKKCSRIRKRLNADSGNQLAMVNMIITIVNQQFGQGDLE
ncbi:gem (nuclear organelle) associated protein 2 [Podila epigama]|nr:gem (nuclear organelle) associated protein 2 [Podila epigama]